MQWLLKAWDVIPSAMIEYSFKKCGISNNLDGTDNNIMFEDVCQCARPRSAMPTTRKQTWIRVMMLPCRYRQRSSTATTKVIFDFEGF